MDAIGSFVFALALAGAIAVIVEVLTEEPRAALSILRDVEAFAREPAPASRRSAAPSLRFELAGATATFLIATAIGMTTAAPGQASDTLFAARDYHSRMLAGTNHGVR
jgi:hypothetical protein